jgi:DNA-binding FadR family transcriptional regulator
VKQQSTTHVTRKLARQAADRIIVDVSIAGWPVGTVFGSETELVERYGLSRAVFREAVRIVEHLQVARMRRGPGGGLVITAPTIDAVTGAVLVYLHYARPEFEEIVEARIVVEDLVVAHAIERMTEAQAVALRGVAADAEREPLRLREFHSVLAQQTQNHVLELLIELLHDINALFVPRWGADIPGATLRDAGDAHAEIADAIVARDIDAARDRMRTHLEEDSGWMRAGATKRLWHDALPGAPANAKRAEALSYDIFCSIVRDGWKVGAYVGSEPELMERYDVSRAVLREAVRLLEHHEVASMRRGPGGGLFVIEPTPTAVTDAAAAYLEWRRTDASSLAEARAGIEVDLLERTIKRLDDDGIAALQRVVTTEHMSQPSAHGGFDEDLHTVIAELSGNRVLEMLGYVVGRLTRRRQRREALVRGVIPAPIEDVAHSHKTIVGAIVARDQDGAREDMRRHLAAQAELLQ